MVKVTQEKMANHQAYEARGVVAKYHQLGHFNIGMLKVPMYKFLTLYQGAGREAMPVELKGFAPVKQDGDDRILDIEKLQEGDIVVHPGLLYRRTFWFDNLMAAHMKALQTYKPKDIIKAEKADAPAIDLGYRNFSQEKITDQDHEKRQVITE